MNVLVDYDNIRLQHRSRGLVYIADRVRQAIGAARGRVPSRVRMRLYGGWYGGAALSHRAQGLAAEARADFPRVLTAAGTGVAVEMELAYSLEIEPHHHLVHTYRVQGAIV